MNAFFDKKPDTTGRAVANAISPIQVRRESAARFTENRETSVAQRKLQNIVNNARQVRQLSAVQEMVNLSSIGSHRNSVLQRAVDLNACENSATGNYSIPINNRKTLYSKTSAPDPVPRSLYSKGNEVTNDLNPINLNSWTPNVRLFSNAERATAQTNRTQEVPSDALCGLAGFLGFTMQVPQHDLEDNLITDLRNNSDGGINAPTTGILGKNDCMEFATHLQHLIGVGTDRPDLSEDLSETRIGDKMGHILTNSDDCPYHYATIVAADGASKITLEANAGKDLTSPEFFIHAGINGFMQANNQDYDNGTQHTITHIGERTLDEHQDALDRKMLNEQTYRTQQGRKLTDTTVGV